MAQDTSKLEQLLAAELSRPLGVLKVKSNLANALAEQAADTAADNLLEKARRNLAAGDHHRAEVYIEKVMGLPDSPLRGGPAGREAAHLMLFSAISDEVKVADEGDSSWLDRALAVLDKCGELAALDLKSALHGVARSYRLEAGEKKRIASVIGNDDHEKELFRRLDSGEAAMADMIRQNLETVLLYERSAD